MTRPSTGSTMPVTLMYHSVAEYESDPFLVTVTPGRFRRQLNWLQQRGLRGVSMRELVAARRRGDTRGLIGLTFDDGYTDFATEVAPTLLRHGFTATVFVLAERLGGTNDWESHGPVRPLMTLDEVRAVAAQGMEVASHGLGHVSLPDVPVEVAAAEIRRSRSTLSALLDQDVAGFAYPYGHVGRREVDLVREAGYTYGCAIWPSAQTSVHALPRAYVGERDGAARLLAKIVKQRIVGRAPAVAR
ncbi:polysaccharide deacetylase family protein [Pseudonocardia acidicola]